MAIDLIGILITTLGFALISFLFASVIIDWINTFIYFFIRDNAEIVAETITGVAMATAGTPGYVEIIIPLLSQDYKYPTIDFGDKIIFVTAKYIGRPLFPGLKDLLEKSLLYVPSTLGVSAILPEESLLDAKRIAIAKGVGGFENYLLIDSQLPAEEGVPRRGAPPRRDMIAWPTISACVTSPYGGSRRHTGIDIGVDVDTPIFASQDGVVVKAQLEGGFGNLVVIKHIGVDGKPYYTYYAHIKCGGFRVKVGNQVIKGQHIANSGGLDECRGNTIPPEGAAHLHFEIRTGRTPSDSYNPCPFLEDVRCKLCP